MVKSMITHSLSGVIAEMDVPFRHTIISVLKIKEWLDIGITHCYIICITN